MPTTWVHLRCGCRETVGLWGPPEERHLDDLCAGCRHLRIGERITFLRFGLPPGGGQSFNGRDRTWEHGVSVYEVRSVPLGHMPRRTTGRADLVGFYFDFIHRPAYRGTGVIVGWGSDGEPLVRIEHYKRVDKRQLARMMGED